MTTREKESNRADASDTQTQQSTLHHTRRGDCDGAEPSTEDVSCAAIHAHTLHEIHEEYKTM